MKKIFIITAILLSSAVSWGALGGQIELQDGRLEITLDDPGAQSKGVNDIIDLFLQDQFEVDVHTNGSGHIDLLLDGDRFRPVTLYGVIYRQGEKRTLLKARVIVPVTDKAFLTLHEKSSFLTLEGQGAGVLFGLLKKHGTQTMSNDRILRYERGEVLCYLRHEDGGHYCMIDL